MGKIITISGVPGSGKTMLRDHLFISGEFHFSTKKDCRIIESVTTRTPRVRDWPNEFLHISKEEFVQREKDGKFLWTTPPIHGAYYGTLKMSVDDAVRSSELSLMVITVDNVPDIIDYVGVANVIALYILSPGIGHLRERMRGRGETLKAIDERIFESQIWDSKAKEIALRYPIRFISNMGKPNDFLADARLSIVYS